METALGACACIHVRTASRVLTRLYDEALSSSGITISQLGLLASIVFRGPVTIGVLAKSLAMDRTTLTADLKPLASRGWVSIVQGHDRRTRVVEVTETGKKTVLNAFPMWQKAQQRITDQLGVDKLEQLLGLMREVVY